MKIFLVRHASPDWDRRDIPYDIRPGPMLTPKGEKEAEILAVFLGSQGVTKLYTSPFERSIRTARIVSAIIEIPFKEEIGLAEWRGADESENQVRQRMTSIFNRAAMESEGLGPIGLVSHGGPIALLLQELGIDKHELIRYRRMFDSTNPLPPAGAWKAEQASGEERWKLELVFTPAW